MFNLSGSEIVFILLLALVVLGPEKLPDAMRRFGRTISELRRMSSGFQEEFRAGLDEPMREMRQTADLIRRNADIGALSREEAPASKAKSPSAMSVDLTPDELAAETPSRAPQRTSAARSDDDDDDDDDDRPIAADAFGNVPVAGDAFGVVPAPDEAAE